MLWMPGIVDYEVGVQALVWRSNPVGRGEIGITCGFGPQVPGSNPGGRACLLDGPVISGPAAEVTPFPSISAYRDQWSAA